MKIFKHRNLMGCIYALLMAVPLFSILGRTCYTIFNKNAYQSYSGDYSQVYETNEVNSRDDIILGNIYEITITSAPTNATYTNIAYLSSAYNITNANGVYDLNVDSNNNSYSILFRYNSSFLTFSNSDNYTTLISIPVDQVSFPYTFNLVFRQVLTGYDYTYSPVSESDFNLFDYNDNASLDNAFDYSLSKFVNDNDFGRLNFFQWFWDIFLTNNQQNNLYIHFVNWYMNFALCVSSAYILFLVLMWFINYSRRILERGMNYDW